MPDGKYLTSSAGVARSKSSTARPSASTIGAPPASSLAGITLPPLAVSAIASIPGTITRNGKSIFGNAAMIGVRRAAVIDSAAIARCTTRKSVHQYPNESTKPSPATSPNHSTPIGLSFAAPMWCQLRTHASLANPCVVATLCSLATSPFQPPTSRSPSHTSGAKPKTIRKNCSTSL